MKMRPKVGLANIDSDSTTESEALTRTNVDFMQKTCGFDTGFPIGILPAWSKEFGKGGSATPVKLMKIFSDFTFVPGWLISCFVACFFWNSWMGREAPFPVMRKVL